MSGLRACPACEAEVRGEIREMLYRRALETIRDCDDVDAEALRMFAYIVLGPRIVHAGEATAA